MGRSQGAIGAAASMNAKCDCDSGGFMGDSPEAVVARAGRWLRFRLARFIETTSAFDGKADMATSVALRPRPLPGP